MIRSTLSLVLLVLLIGVVLTSGQTSSSVPSVGDSIPDVHLRNLDDKRVSLRQLVASRPTVLVFYRGDWCPFCTKYLKALTGIEKEVAEAGGQLVAVSMDQPAKLKETLGRIDLGYALLSDADGEAVKAFGLAFEVDVGTVRKYKSYGIDLEASSGRTHHLLPRPAVVVAGVDGRIRFFEVNPDYKVRTHPTRILDALRKSLPAPQAAAAGQ